MSLSTTPSNILLLVLLLIFLLFLLGNVSVITYRYFFLVTGAPVRVRQEPKVDLEAGTTSTCYTTAPSLSTSFWSRFTFRRPRPAEAELPWPVLAVLPSLRPKRPIHRRVLTFLMVWKKEEVKREPFTVADVLKAIEDVNNRTQAANAPQAHDVDHAEHATRTAEFKGWRRLFLFTLFSRTSSEKVPSIIIHPCDGTPSFPYRDDSRPLAMPSTSHVTIYYAPSTPPSPTVSEPDSPGPATPALESSNHFSGLPYLSECTDIPVPSSTGPLEENGQVSKNMLGKASTVGLGLDRLAASQSVDSDLVDVSFTVSAVYEDASDGMTSSFSSEHSVVDLRSVLNSIASSTSNGSEGFVGPSSRRKLGGSSSDDREDADNASIRASGDREYYECSADSSFSLGFDLEDVYAAIGCVA
ncbi:hypothetical protein C8Q80DRAFT_277208 [Daedaleopsis nitida]|nr:hypothetical protein C8Q80DRAFT_277208 [Daedaleopsis nitida]